MSDEQKVKNGEVTAAILEAEHHTHLAAMAWKRVKEAEEAIANDENFSKYEREVALRGVRSAQDNFLLVQKADRYR